MRIGVDVGGTFTDVVLVDDERATTRALKVPTTTGAPQRAVGEALRRLLGDRARSVTWLGHATTIATNALLGQIGLELPRVAIVTTHGFADVIEIGRQNRSAVYDLFVERPRMLVARENRLTVHERIDHRGRIVEPLDEASLVRVCGEITSRGIESVAVCFLHAYANDVHERVAADRIARTCGTPVALSSEVDPEYREYERFSTTVVTAALAPIVGAYLRELAGDVCEMGIEAPLYVMRSDGGLSEASAAASRPAALIESGPASGAIAAAAIARKLRIDRVLSFDMGGTTAKAAAIRDGTPEVVYEYEAAGASQSGRAVRGSGYPVRYPFVDLAEVSAGGGTIAWVDEAGALRVGPLSAGADPGPACYGRSERATVTDANVVLGRLDQRYLLGGTFPIDATRSRAAVAHLAEQIGLSVEATAAGIVRIVDAQMSRALRIVTVERGFDTRDFTLVAFGGNGPLHACELADELSIGRIIVPAMPGMFSAVGLLEAELSATHVAPVLASAGDVDAADLEQLFAALEERGRTELLAQGASESEVRCERTFEARYRGQSFELSIEHASSPQDVARRFHDAHRTRYGYAALDEPVELVNARATLSAGRDHDPRPDPRNPVELEPARARNVWISEAFANVPVVSRGSLDATRAVAGPAIIEQYDCTTYVGAGWIARLLASGELELTTP